MDTRSNRTWSGTHASGGTTWGSEEFVIDLNNVRDGNRVVSLIGSDRPQRVPVPGDGAVVIDEDGNAYDALVETVLPDSRVYLRVKWQSKRTTTPPLVATYGRPEYRWEPKVENAAT